MVITFTLVISVVLLIYGHQIIKLYQLSPDTEALAIQVIRYHAIMAVFVWVPSFTLPNTLRASGDVIWTMIIAIASMWIFRIGTAYVFSKYFSMGLMGVWIAMTIDWIFRAICYEVRYHGKRWEYKMRARS